MNVSAASREPCRVYGHAVPLQDVLAHLENGWQLLDDFARDPLGRTHALLEPPARDHGAR